VGARRLRHVGTTAALACLLAVAGCGDDDGTTPEAQPAPDATTFEEGDFEDLPLPPLAEPFGERSEEDGIVTRSFVIRNRTPEDVMTFYETELSEAQVVTAPEQSGADTLRAEWLLDDGRTLLVTSLPAPTAEGDEVEDADVVTQFSLTLRPEGDSDHED
jgi:hypothetical protein